MNYVQVINGQVINTRVISIRAQARAAMDAVNALTTQLDVVNYTISMS